MAKKDFKFCVGSVIGLGRGTLDETVWWDVIKVAEDGPGMMIREHGKTHYKSQYCDRSMVTRVRANAVVGDDGKVSVAEFGMQKPTSTIAIVRDAYERAVAMRKALGEFVTGDIEFARRSGMLTALNAADELVYELDSIHYHALEEAGRTPTKKKSMFHVQSVRELLEKMESLPVSHPLAGYRVDDSETTQGLWGLIKPTPGAPDGYYTWNGLLDRLVELEAA